MGKRSLKKPLNKWMKHTVQGKAKGALILKKVWLQQTPSHSPPRPKDPV